MGWFSDQIKDRKKHDDIDFSEALDSLAGAVVGKKFKEGLSSNEIAESAIERILMYYHFKPKDVNGKLFNSNDERLEYMIRPFGIKSRKVTLEPKWHKCAVGPMLGTLKSDGTLVALIPDKFSGYRYLDISTGKNIKVNNKVEKLLEKEAICFYEPLPLKSLTIKDLLIFMFRQLSVSDIILYIGLILLSSLFGLLTPLFTKWLFGDVLQTGSIQVLLSLAVFILSYSISTICFNTFKSIINSRILTKQNLSVEAAVMNRVLSLKPSFYKDYSSGELSQKTMYIQNLCISLFGVIGNTGLTSVFSLIYIIQIFSFAPSLVVPSLLISLSTVLISIITILVQMKISKKRLDVSAKTSGLTYSTITGIQKIKLAGAEKRMFARWAREYSKEIELTYNPPLFLKISGAISLTISLFGTLILYYLAVANEVNVSNYYAFNSSYGMISAAFMAVVSIVRVTAEIKPTLELVKPIMEATPENNDGKDNINELSGNIELNHVSFSYADNEPNVIDDLSLKIKKGEYLAIVGATGCGKTTLMRLLLGFETPKMGIITYDKKDINKIVPESLRNHIGVVMQDGKLFTGDIYSNIVITAPHLTLDDAWEAAKIASIDEDIHNMPMGMSTLISEGQGGFSGGQKQRLMIARAIVNKPNIIMFDEATSALDNITQKKISEAIDSMKCTRIVIAHRLSTIMHADRIIYLEKGKIVEEGTYSELIAKNGHFKKLVERQRLDIN